MYSLAWWVSTIGLQPQDILSQTTPEVSTWLETSFWVEDRSVKQGMKTSLIFLSDGLVAGRPSPWSLIRGFRSVSPHSHLALQPYLWSPFLQIPSSSLAVQTQVSRSNASVSRQPTFPKEETAWSQACCDIDRAEHFQSSQILDGVTASDQADWIYEPASVSFIALSVSFSFYTLGFWDEFLCHPRVIFLTSV